MCLINIPTYKLLYLSTKTCFSFRFYDVDKGTITVGGTNVRELDPSWLRGRAIGFINQEPILFATSIMENIRYGRPGASDDEVVAFSISVCSSEDF